MKKSLIKRKSYKFALEIIKLYKFLLKENEHILSKQLLKSGTSIGVNIEEAVARQSKADFLSKMSIASKEAREAKYRLRLFQDSEIIKSKHTENLLIESGPIVRMFIVLLKQLQQTMQLKTQNQELRTDL